MNKLTDIQLEKLAVFTVLVLFVAFIVLLVLGTLASSLTMIVFSFICGFIGFAISQYESHTIQ